MAALASDLLRGREIVWAPQRGAQESFLSCPVFEVLLHGNRGGGKTDALLMDFAQYVGRGFGAAWRGILFRRTYKELEDVIAKSQLWFPRIWPTAQYNASGHTWRWPTGETLLLRHFMRHSDYNSYHGHAYPWIGWEELTRWPDDVGFKRMFSCCRSATQGMPRHIRATTNPAGPGHNWVKLRFRLPHMDGRVFVDPESGLQRVSISAKLNENRVLLGADPEYQSRIVAAARNPAEREAWLTGSWDIVSGGMFDDVWQSAKHIIDPFEIPVTWRMDRSFDWGSSKPFAVCWWAESDGSDVRTAKGWSSTVRGDLFLVREWYGWNGRPNEGLKLLASDISKGIVEREVHWGWRNANASRVRAGVADSSIFTVENGSCIATDMAKRVRIQDGREYPGVQWLPADKSPGSRKNGWDTMRQAIKHSLPVERGAREKPGVFVFRSCEQFLRTVPTLPRDERDPDDVDTDAEDHMGDAVRYRLRARGNRAGSTSVVGAH